MKLTHILFTLIPHFVVSQVPYPKQEIDSLYKAGLYAIALKKNSEYLSAAERTADCQHIPLALYKSGEILDMLQKREEAYRFFHLSLSNAKQCKNDSVEWLATRYLGGFFYRPGAGDSALYYLNKAYHMIKDKNLPREISSVTGMLGETWSKIFLNEKEGVRWYKISLDYALRSGNYHPLGYAYFRYGAYLAYHGNCKDGLPMVEKSLALFSENNDAEGEVWLMKGLSKIYEDCSEVKLGQKLSQKLIYKQDSLFSIETARQTAQYQTLYETEKKEQSIKILQAEATLRQQQIIFLIVFSLLMVAAVFFFQNRRALKLKLKRNQDELNLKEAHHQEISRISRELHDNVGTNLSLMISNLDYLNHKQKIEGLEKVSDTARNTLQQLRETIWATDRPSFKWQDFKNKLEHFVGQLAQPEHPIKFKLNIPSISSELKPGQVLNLFRIVQESVINAVKHADTKEILIELQQVDSQLTLTIKDSGKGFNAQHGYDGHYGLSNLKKRAEALGGSLNIVSSAEAGTSICLKMVVEL